MTTDTNNPFLSLLARRPGSTYWPLTAETAAMARELVEAGKLVVADAEANEGRGTYRLNAEPEPENENKGA